MDNVEIFNPSLRITGHSLENQKFVEMAIQPLLFRSQPRGSLLISKEEKHEELGLQEKGRMFAF